MGVASRSAWSFWFRGFVACAGRDGLLGLNLGVGFGEALLFRMLGLRFDDVGCNRNSEYLPLLRISRLLNGLCSL